MYAQITFNNNVPATDALADIVAILTGETSLNNLISDINTEFSL